ncbi:MAG: patatin-like phospholipase family protein, partial [Candidatus Berkiellales bacterium]
MMGSEIATRIAAIWSKALGVSTLEREKRPPPENAVFEGGGGKGLVFPGALEVLELNGIFQKLKRVAGSSAGGIIAVLIAVGYTPKEIIHILKYEIDFKQLMDTRVSFDPTRVFKLMGMKVGLTDIIMLFKHKGVYKGDAFEALAKKIIARKIQEHLHLVAIKYNTTVADILKKYDIENLGEITFSQFENLRKAYPELPFKELYLTGTKLSDGSLKVFSADTDPHMKMVAALRITMSFPLGFEPVLYQGEYYIDGGVADNYPMQIFDQDKFLSHGLNEAKVNPCTIGFLVDTQAEIDARWGVKSKETKK